MKALHFIINANLLIATAAVLLAMSTQVQLGLPASLDAGLLLIFFATSADYNLHRLLAVYKNAGAAPTAKLAWANGHRRLLMTLTACSAAGLIICLFYVKTEVLFLLMPLALFSFAYSFFTRFRVQIAARVFAFPGIKTIILALVWASATVFIPALQAQTGLCNLQMLLVFAQRLIFIFAIAIPFDIRDMIDDSKAGIISIPILAGAKNAIRICNTALVLSVVPAILQYLSSGVLFMVPASLLSLVLILFLVNNKKAKSHPLYYHGILDGSIMMYALIVILSACLIV